jgi:deazaflavin-dependent oxidoreductase (nitroreductase family)
MSLQSQVLRLHERIYKATDGRLGHKMVGVPTLLLRTVGRRSGAQRTNALVYARDGDDYLVVASNGGADKPPAWLHNLRADPEVGIQVGRDRQPATAKALLPEDPDYDRLWKVVNDNTRDRYNGYTKLTDRPIPIVVLTPGGAPAAS